MRTITNQEYEIISDAEAGGLTTLLPGVLEKDVLLTDALRCASQLDIGDFALIFCGGTCLSKAHKIIERMSEDMDFKVVVPDGLSRSARSKQLSAIKKNLVEQFTEIGFSIPEQEVRARDENNYIAMNLHYETRFSRVESLRSAIKIELNARPPSMPTQRLRVRSILDDLPNINRGNQSFDIECISVHETLAEKTISFLRRTAELLSGRNRGGYDDRLVRHLYDILAIARKRPEVLGDLPYDRFQSLVEGDAAQFRNQHPEFEVDPISEMRNVISALYTNDRFEKSYLKFVDDLVYGDAEPYGNARQVFVRISEELVDSLVNESAAHTLTHP